MKKNTASQKIGAQLVSATDGSAFTGAVTVFVTGDAGTQTQGTVGSGACTHEGNGFHTYSPSQAESNFDHIAFTFTGTGAVPVTVQLYTEFPQTGDVYPLVDTEVAAIKAKTDNLPSDPADASDIAASFSTVNTILGTLSGYVDTEVAAIKAKTDLIPAAPAAVSDIPTAAQNAAGLLDLAAGVETGLTLRQALRLLVAAEAGKLSGAATTTIVIRNYGDSKNRITGTVDSDGNRTAISYDLT